MTQDTTAEKARECLTAQYAGELPSYSSTETLYPESVVIRAMLAFAALTATPAQGEWISVPREQMARVIAPETWTLVDHWRSRNARPDLEVRAVEAIAPSLAKADAILLLAASPVARSSGEWIEREVVLALIEAERARAANANAHAITERTDASTAGIMSACGRLDAALRALELPSTPKPQELAGER